MYKYKNFLVGLVLAGSFLLPISASAVGVPFGGLVTATIPCHIGPVPALYINVLGFSFIETAGTVPYLYYVPRIGQYILGLADVPIVCSVGIFPLPPGLRIQIYGTSGLSVPGGGGGSFGGGGATGSF